MAKITISATALRALARKHSLDSSGKKEDVQKRLMDAGHFPVKGDPTLFPTATTDNNSTQTLFLQLAVDNIGR